MWVIFGYNTGLIEVKKYFNSHTDAEKYLYLNAVISKKSKDHYEVITQTLLKETISIFYILFLVDYYSLNDWEDNISKEIYSIIERGIYLDIQKLGVLADFYIEDAAYDNSPILVFGRERVLQKNLAMKFLAI